MRRRLVQLGVPEPAIDIDESGTSTRRSVRAVANRVRTDEPIIFVSSAYHLPRVNAEARRRGLNASASAASARVSLRQELREAVARVAYAVTV